MVGAKHLLSSELSPEHLYQDESSHPWLNTSLNKTPRTRQTHPARHCVLEPHGSTDRQVRGPEALTVTSMERKVSQGRDVLGLTPPAHYLLLSLLTSK
jgi:hypothetical protein